METKTLDLRAERCPMALLLAKRGCKTLKVGERLEILVSDPSSSRDIESYLLTHGYKLHNESVGDSYRICAIKEIS